MKHMYMRITSLCAFAMLFFAGITANAQNAWINEFHYDNDGSDTGEFIEIVIANPGDFTLSDFAVFLYNGNGGGQYDSLNVADATAGADSDANFGIYTLSPSSIQNGNDGIAISYQGSLIQFISYEGGFTATDGPANGTASVDLSVSESGSTPVGESLQLSGTGSVYSDFTWQAPAAETPGLLNNSQTLEPFDPNAPTITIDETGFVSNFGETAVGSSSTGNAVSISGSNLTADITVTASADFEVSTDNSTFSSSVTLTQTSGEVAATSVFIRFSPSSIGPATGTVTASSTNADDRTVEVSGLGIGAEWQTVFAEDFTNCGELNAFDTVNVVGDQVWSCSSNGLEGDAAYMSGFSGSALDNEDWLIASVDATNFSTLYLDFYTWTRFSGPELQLFVSTSYDPNQALNINDWTEITTFTKPSSQQSWTFSDLINLANYTEQSFYIGFRYTSNPTDGSAQWLVDNVQLRGDVVPSAPILTADFSNFDGDFGYVDLGNTSDARSYTVSGENLTGDLSIAPPTAFEVSTTQDFSTNVGTVSNPLIITPTNGTIATTTIYVRFKPETEYESYSGEIIHSSEGATNINTVVSGFEGIEGEIIPISVARNKNIGDRVDVTGIVIGGPNNSSQNRVIYDGTAGIVVRGNNSGDLVLGDSVSVTGALDEFGNLLQIAPSQDITIIAQGIDLPEPTPISLAEVGEDYESELVILTDVSFKYANEGDTIFAGGGGDGNFIIENSAGDTLTFRIGSSSHPLVGQAVPTEPVTIIGFIGQFFDDYQISVESPNDIILPASLTSDQQTLSFGSVEVGSTSNGLALNLTAQGIDGDVTVGSSSSNFEVSLSETSGYQPEITVPTIGGEYTGPVYVRFTPQAEGQLSGTITLGASNLDADVTVAVDGIGEARVTATNEALLNGVLVYPNPTESVLRIELDSSKPFTYRVMNLQGAILESGSGQNEVSINSAGLESGIYLIEVREADKVFRSRIIKR